MVSAFGISVSRFYCCGVLKTQSVGLALFSKQTTKDDACCRHTQTVIKVNDNQQQREAAFSLPVNSVDVACIKPAVVNQCFTNLSITRHTNFVNSPPGLQSAVPLYTRICAYRI